MKVLMIDHFSSVSMYSTDLCDELCKLADVDLLTVNDSALVGEKGYKYEKSLYGHYDGNKLGRATRYIVSLFKCFRKILFGNYDVIHIQSFRNVSVESRLYKITRRKKAIYVHTLHNILPHEASQKDKENYGRIYDLCDSLVAHNQASMTAFAENFPKLVDKVSIIPHGAYSYIRNMVRQKEASDKTIFFMLGLIRKYKGADILLEAVSKLSVKDRENCHVIIAGRQDKRLDPTDYESYISENDISNTVTFIPEKISDEKMAEFYNEADVCVFPYRSIYGSGSLLMAYAFSKPVLVSDVPAFIEETEQGQTGLLFESENADDLAEKMHTFITMPYTEKLKYKESIERLTEHKYNWKKCAEKTMEVYRRTL